MKIRITIVSVMTLLTFLIVGIWAFESSNATNWLHFAILGAIVAAITFWVVIYFGELGPIPNTIIFILYEVVILLLTWVITHMCIETSQKLNYVICIACSSAPQYMLTYLIGYFLDEMGYEVFYSRSYED